MTRLLALAVAGLVLAGCGGGDEAQREGEAPGAGTKRHEVASQGFSVALPSDWKSIAPGEVLSSDELQELQSENPQISRYIEALEGKDSPIKYFAYDPDIEQEFATNLNVVVFPVPRKLSFEELRDSTVTEVEALPSRTTEVKAERSELAAGDAVRLTFQQQFETADGAQQEVATTQYALVIEKRAFVLTFTTLPGEEAAYRDVFAAAAESLQVEG